MFYGFYTRRFVVVAWVSLKNILPLITFVICRVLSVKREGAAGIDWCGECGQMILLHKSLRESSKSNPVNVGNFHNIIPLEKPKMRN